MRKSGPIYEAILQLGTREGMTTERLEASRIFSLVENTPPGWITADSAAALGRLITEVVSGLSSINIRSAARFALNLTEANFPGSSAAARWRTLAKAKGASEDTVRKWWYEAATALATALPNRIEQVNRDRDWPKYRVRGASGRASDSLPPYRFARIDSSFWLEGRKGVRSVSSRRVVALEDGVDRVLAVGRYYADPRPGAATIEPLMNCELVSTRRGRGATVAELGLAQPLQRDEEAFISYAISYSSDEECEPVVTHEVTAASVGLYVTRVQFDRNEIPQPIWYFSARTQADALVEPEPGETRFVPVSQLGYSEHRFHDCEYGVTYGLAWRWETSPASTASPEASDLHE
jgi:hypothetical protein